MSQAPENPAEEEDGVIVRDEPMVEYQEDGALTALQDWDEDDLTTLQQHIFSEEWDDALQRLRSHPHEVHHPKAQPGSRHQNMTALHFCLENVHCPMNVIQAILARKPLAAAMRDVQGSTPLHMACAGEFAYDQNVIASLLAAYPQAVLLQEDTDKATPLHLLFTLGGDVNVTCVTMLLDVAYSKMAGLPLGFVPLVDFICSPLETSLEIAANYPPTVVQSIWKMAIDDPSNFPTSLQPFLFLPEPTTLEVPPSLLQNQQKLLLIQDTKQFTPLHIACSSGLTLAVIQKLLNDSLYPGGHEATRKLDHKNRYPLFYASAYGVPFDASKLIFDLFPEAVHEIDTYNIYLVHSAFISTIFSKEDKKFEIKCDRSDPSMPIESCFQLESAYRQWRLYEFFLRLTYHMSYEDPPPRSAEWRVLHALAAIQSPPQLIRCSIRLHPWQVRQRDESGHLPLHIACKNPYKDGRDEIHGWCLKGVNREKLFHRFEPEDRAKDNPIAMFVERHPKGAGYLDKDNCLPLHSAISSGKNWNDGIDSLINAAPLALSTRCGKTRLYPFMLAAVDDVNTLDLVFRLLSTNPSILHSVSDSKVSISKTLGGK